MLVLSVGCDPPVPGPTGGVILVIRTFEAAPSSRFAEVEHIVIQYERLDAIVSGPGGTSHVTVDSELREVVLVNEDRDVFVAQLQVPVGELEQLRVFPARVVLHTRGGETLELGPDGPELPSWSNTGWKIVPEDGVPFIVVENEFTGVRGLLGFDDRLVRNGPRTEPAHRWKIKPTLPAVDFLVNPPPGEAGLFIGQITVVFVPGTTRAEVDTINMGIGATVLIAPIISDAYRMQLPTSITVEDAAPYYRGQAAVQGVLPALNYAPLLDPSEGSQANHTTANLPNAWGTLNLAGLPVGSRNVGIAVIDTGFSIFHPDMILNIGIHQDEIPLTTLAATMDVDGDGVISFVDLNDPLNSAIAPVETGTIPGIIDADDLLNDIRWADEMDTSGNGFEDDLVGWNFGNNTNRVLSGDHGTRVASLAGAVGNNGQGIAGASWNVSIFPLEAGILPFTGTGVPAVPDVRYFDAITYAEGNRSIHIVNTSLAHHVASENADLSCTDSAVCFEECRKYQTTIVPQDAYDQGLLDAVDAFRIPELVDGMDNPVSRLLYLFAAGNSAMNLADPNIVIMPGEIMQTLLGDGVLIVGSVDDTMANAGTSGFGSPVVNIWAPGNGWVALGRSGGLADCSGTSCAAPTVAGIGALVLSRFPGLMNQPQMLGNRLISRTAPTVNVSVGSCTNVETNVPLVDANAAVMLP